MVKQIYDIISGVRDDTNVPSSSTIVQTYESNLDVDTLTGTKNLDLQNLDEFEHYDLNDVLIFKGTIRDNNSGDLNTFTGFDFGIVLGEVRIRKNFENLTPLQIMEDIITNFTPLTWVTPTGIVDGDAITLYPSQNKKASVIFEDMHKYLGTTHYVNFDKEIIIEYEGQETNTNVLTINVNCSLSAEGWQQDTSQLVKNLQVNGDTKEIQEVVTFDGDNSTTTFTLANAYVEIKVVVDGVELSPTVPDITVGDYEIRKETRKIIFAVAPSTGTDNIEITYVYQIQANYNIVEVTNTEVLAGSNPHEKTITDLSLKEVVETRVYANKYKNKFGQALRDATILVPIINTNQYRANQSIQVVDNYNKLNGSYINDTFLIKSVRRTFGADGYFLELKVGDSRSFVYDRERQVNQKIRELNENTPTAEIFNEGIATTTRNNISIEYDIEVTLYKADLPTNILVYDEGRTYTNEADHLVANDGFVYIDQDDYDDLFEEVL